MKLIDGLPHLPDRGGKPTLRVCGQSGFVRSARFLARVCLQSGEIEWLVERSPTNISEAVRRLPRVIWVSGSDLWFSEADQVVAEITSTECGGLTVSARDAATGSQLWEQFIRTPEAADWAEPSPAWPGAQTEEISAFVADAPGRLVVGLFRQTRRSTMSWPAGGIDVSSLPTYACQTDAICFDLLTGNIYQVHRAANTDVFVGTDGNGGRLLAVDALSGKETLNLKPALGGVGDLAKVIGHNVLVSGFRESRSYAKAPRLLVLSMNHRRNFLEGDCFSVVGAWQHGAVCRAGQRGERLAVIDIRGRGHLR